MSTKMNKLRVFKILLRAISNSFSFVYLSFNHAFNHNLILYYVPLSLLYVYVLIINLKCT